MTDLAATVSPADLEWETRPHADGEPARHVAELSDALGAVHVRANLWRYEPGAAGKRHVHASQEETFVVLAGTLTMYTGEPPERHDIVTGGVIHVPGGLPLQSANHGDVDLLVYAYGYPPDEGATVLESALPAQWHRLERTSARRPTLDDVSWPIHTPRLTLRRAVEADGEAVFAYRRLPEVGRWLTDIQIDRAIWARRWSKRVDTTVVVELDGALIGDTRVVVEDAYAQGEVIEQGRGVQAELMWAFDPAWHGHGYATETVSALVELSFARLGLRRLVAFCYADNEPSWRLMERVGMRREGRSVESTLQRDGTWRDFLSYALLAPPAPADPES